jgi:hypothetical protein
VRSSWLIGDVVARHRHCRFLEKPSRSKTSSVDNGDLLGATLDLAFFGLHLFRGRWWRVDGIDPGHLLRRLCGSDVQVHDDGVLPAPNQNAAEGLVSAGIDLLMGDERRHVDEISRSRLRQKLQAITPAHPGAAADDVDDAFEVAVMMGARFRVWMDGDGAGPELARAGSRVRDGRRSRHARRLGRIQIQR